MSWGQFFILLAAVLTVGVKVQAGRTVGISKHDPFIEVAIVLVLALSTLVAGVVLLALELS